MPHRLVVFAVALLIGNLSGVARARPPGPPLPPREPAWNPALARVTSEHKRPESDVGAPNTSASAGEPTGTPSCVAGSQKQCEDLRRAVLWRRWRRVQRLASQSCRAGNAPTHCNGPVMQYLLALASLHNSTPLETLRLLEGFKGQVPPPLLKPWQELLAEARRRSTPLQERLPQLLRSRNAQRLLAATEELLKLELFGSADKLLRRLGSLPLGGSSSARLRSLRAQWALHHEMPYRAYTDWRWLLLNEPLTEDAAKAEQQLSKHFPQHRLSVPERRARLAYFVERGALTNAQVELRKLTSEKGFQMPQQLQLRLQARAAYRGRLFADSANLFEQASDAGGILPQKDRYLAARAHSRGGLPREALPLFSGLAESQPPTSLTAMAQLKLAQQWSWLGEWTQAENAFTAYLKRNQGGEGVVAALRGQALAQLASGKNSLAVVSWRRLRARHPRSEDASLFHLLEALALQQEPAEGVEDALEEISSRLPLSYSAWMARRRLRLVNGNDRDAVPRIQPRQDKGTGSGELPLLVRKLESVGLIDEASAVMRKLEPVLSQQRDATDETSRCGSHDGLSHGRRRFLLGISAAQQIDFHSQPATAPRALWNCLYPRPYEDLVTDATREFNVPVELVYAVMRQESGFRPRVRSPANARGLMQIIPRTGRAIARALGVSYNDELLYDPASSIRFGTFYLGRLLEQFHGHPALAAAAYNAGPEAAALWSRAVTALPLEAFVARIPFRETRGYVRRVLSNMLTYEALSERPPPTTISLSLPSVAPSFTTDAELLRRHASLQLAPQRDVRTQ